MESIFVLLQLSHMAKSIQFVNIISALFLKHILHIPLYWSILILFIRVDLHPMQDNDFSIVELTDLQS